MVAEGDLINLEEKGRSMKLTSSIPKKKKANEKKEKQEEEVKQKEDRNEERKAGLQTGHHDHDSILNSNL
jgi:hypothetical protein